MEKGTNSPRVGIIGSGVAGLCQAIQLKRQLNHVNFTIYEQESHLGGTWNVNTYPGCACDIPGIFYSFSFDPHPGSTFFPPQKEIRSYLHSVSDKYGITPHIVFNTTFTAANWNESTSTWTLRLKDAISGNEREEEVEILILAIGGLAIPNDCTIPGAKEFKGPIFHSARWNHDVSLKDKNVIVVGNGCSASQLIPAILGETKSVTQFIRTPQWYLKSLNFTYPPWSKFLFKYIPGTMWLWRFIVYAIFDFSFILLTKKYATWRLKMEKNARTKILRETPEKYHSFILPNYSIGCKRRVLDPDFIYLQSLHSPKMHLTNVPLRLITADTVQDSSGKTFPADIIVLANGFHIGAHLARLDIRGRKGLGLLEYWGEKRAVSSYKSAMVSEFPNFFFLDGPNSASGHFSVIYTVECQVNYVTKLVPSTRISRLLAPVVRRQAEAVVVKGDAEDEDVEFITEKQTEMVWHKDVGGCASWYYDEKTGRNDLLFPDFQTKFYLRTLFPIWKHFMYKNNKGTWIDGGKVGTLRRWFGLSY